MLLLTPEERKFAKNQLEEKAEILEDLRKQRDTIDRKIEKTTREEYVIRGILGRDKTKILNEGMKNGN